MVGERRGDQGVGQYLSRGEFEEAMKRVDGRLNQQDGELTKIRERIHTIANHCAKIQQLEIDMDKLGKAMERVPRKEDIEYATQTLKMRLDQQDKDTEKRSTWNRWALGIALVVGMPIMMLILQVLAKAMKLL